jgi:hypothetical protein
VNDDLTVKWRTPDLIVASVRDDIAGVVDVRWSSGAGWSCTCRDELNCCHVPAVQQLTEVVA